MAPPRICILFTIPNFKTAGSQYVLRALLKRLDPQVFSCYVLVERFPELCPPEIPANHFLYLPKGKNKADYISGIAKIIKTHKIELVHSWDYRSSSKEAIACRIAGVPYIYTKKNNAWSKRWYAKSLISRYIVYNNPEMKTRFFSNPLLKNKAVFIPHGIDSVHFSVVKNDKKRPDFVIGCIGVLGPNKNQLFILKALRTLPQHFVVRFYGKEDETYKKILDEFIDAHQLGDRVSFHGYIQNEKIPEVMSDLDVLVLASIHEGLPLCIIEAMACEVPVLSSDSGGGAQFLLSKGGGSIFSLDTTEQFSRQLVELHADDMKRHEIGKAGRIAVLEDFTIEKEVESYTNLYKRICS